MKPLISLNAPGPFTESGGGSFQEKYVDLGGQIGAKKLGFNLTVVPPGKKSCPFHNHRVNEEFFLIIEGRGKLRFGDQTYPLQKHDLISCPPGDQTVAHQILNTGDTELSYLALSTTEPHEIVEFPDSKKVMCMSGKGTGRWEYRFVGKAEQAVDYLDGES